MGLITGIVSLVILLGSLSRILIPIIRKKPSLYGFGTTLTLFLGILGGIMSLTGNWKWWWVVPSSSVSIYAILQLIAQITSWSNGSEVLKKFLPLTTILSTMLLLISVIPGLKDIVAQNMSSGIRWPIIIISTLIIIFALFIGVGAGNIMLGFLTAGNIMSKNWVRIVVSLISTIWLGIYFGMSTDQMYKWFTGETLTNTLALRVLQLLTFGLGIISASAFFAATLTNLPNEMGFRERFKSIFQGGIWALSLKIILVLVFIIGLIIGLVKLGIMNMSTSIANIITLTIQILCIIAILFGAFRYVINNPRLLSSIKNNFLIKLLFNIIMTIPCLLIYLTQAIFGTISATGAAAGKGASFATKLQIASPPKMVLIILAVEILTVSSYVLLPMFRKWIYTFTPGNNGDIVLRQRIAGVQNVILAARNKFTDDISVNGTKLNDINWEKIYSENLYLLDDIHTKALKGYLTNLGYKDYYDTMRDNELVNNILGKPITLNAAISFIQTKNKVDTIISDSLNIKHLANKLEALEKQPEAGGSFDSKILNNKPTYINKKTHIGLYENLKGQTTSTFSDNKVVLRSADAADDYNYNYGLSAWIFLMAQPPSYGVGYSKFTKVLDYAGKPTILYNPDLKTLKITMNTYKKENGAIYAKTIYKTTDFPLQRWNNIVINTVGGTLDIFINKNLVASISNIIPYMTNDAIVIGDKPGISGAVANVTYFSKPISQQKITFFYNNLVNKDPPVI